MSNSTHYVAHLKIEKVIRKENNDRGSASHGQTQRDVTETTNLTIKSATLEGLKLKVKQHTDLLDEEDL